MLFTILSVRRAKKVLRKWRMCCGMKHFVIGSLCALTVSCFSGDAVKYRLSYKYVQSVSDIKYPDISNTKKAFRTDGYYVRKVEDRDYSGEIRILIFYDDGTFSNHLMQTPKDTNDVVDIDKYIIRSKSSILYNYGEYYGVYRVDGDTIFVNEYRRDLIAGFEMYKLHFLIINDETLLYFYFEDPQQIYKNETIKWDRNEEYVFRQAKLPKPHDRFLKKKKWLWEKTADWEHYMNHK